MLWRLLIPERQNVLARARFNTIARVLQSAVHDGESPNVTDSEPTSETLQRSPVQTIVKRHLDTCLIDPGRLYEINEDDISVPITVTVAGGNRGNAMP